MAINRIVIKDRHGNVIASDSFASLERVSVNVDGNVGTPSATASYENGVLSIAFKNIKGVQGEQGVQGVQGARGNGIASVTKIESSEADGGTNIWRVTDTDGNYFDISVNNGNTGATGATGAAFTYADFTAEQLEALKVKGDKGDQGDSAVFDPDTGNILATLHNDIGYDDANAMTQNAVTNAVLPIENKQYSMPCLVPRKMIYTNGELAGNSGTYGTTDFMMLEDGQTKLKVISGVWHASTSYCQVYFYTAADETTGISGVRDTSSSTAREITNHTYDVPTGAKYFRFTVKQNVPAVIEIKGSIVNAIEALQGTTAGAVGDIEDITSELAQNDLTTQRCANALNVNAILVGSANDGSALSTSGNLITNQYTTSRGVSDFIAVTEGDVWLLESGFYQGSTGYAYACFYTAASESAFLSKLSGTQGDITNTSVTVPDDATYMRLTLGNKAVGGIISKGTPVNVQTVKTDVDTIKANKFEVRAQIRNNPLPIKDTTQTLEILFIGSSYSVDTITALHDICANVGLHVNTGNFYKSGATIAQYLESIANNSDELYYYNKDGEARSSTGSYKKVTNIVKGKAWDILIIDDNYGRTPVYSDTRNEDMTKFVEWIKMNVTNPRVVLALNSTWVFKANMAQQEDSFRLMMKNMYYTGIDVIIPSGAAICNLRETEVNDGNDIYRDALHLDLGVGRFTAACAAFFSLVYPVFGVNLDNCNLTGYWDGQGGVNVSSYPDTIEVSSENRDICIQSAWKANGNRFRLSYE